MHNESSVFGLTSVHILPTASHARTGPHGGGLLRRCPYSSFIPPAVRTHLLGAEGPSPGEHFQDEAAHLPSTPDACPAPVAMTGRVASQPV